MEFLFGLVLTLLLGFIIGALAVSIRMMRQTIAIGGKDVIIGGIIIIVALVFGGGLITAALLEMLFG